MVITCSMQCLRGIVAALALLTATAAQAVVYKWVEDDGSVIYSNEPPPDPGKVRELTRIDDMELVPLDRRSGESVVSDMEKRSSPSAVAAPRPAIQQPQEPVTLLPREPVTLLPREPAALPRETEAPPRAIPRSTHTGAVQDPCLVSPDPRCHERNKGRYHPFLGYTPAEEPPQAAGVSSGAGAGGAVAGQVPAAQASAPPPKRGAQALPPGGSITIEWVKPVR